MLGYDTINIKFSYQLNLCSCLTQPTTSTMLKFKSFVDSAMLIEVEVDAVFLIN
jgi:hypothetical protein